ncbi:MAG: LysR family transcriptional regulator [Candidatus Korobacteraceae bacterium]|jgi:DNA-binding transcriptional LysR family regulator
MEVRQLEIFQALAEELNFTRTAERVHCVQSNVTGQIRALEQELGTQLFDRLSKRVVLTEAGKRLLPYAEKVLGALSEAKQVLSPSSVPSGPLKVGAPESVLTYRLPRVLRKFRKRYPEVELIFRPDPVCAFIASNSAGFNEDGFLKATLVESLATGQLDLTILMADGIANERLSSIPLRTEKILFVAGPTHPLASRAKVAPEDLSGQTMLLTEAGCAYRKKLDDFLSQRGIRPKHTTEFGSMEAIKGCVALGMGIALLPQIAVAADLRDGRLVALHWIGPRMDIASHVIWHREKWVSPAMDAFIKTLQQELQE